MGSLTKGATFVSPMLAVKVPGQPAEIIDRLHATGRYLWQVKWDGIRALVYITNRHVEIRNRRGANITSRYPDVVANLAEMYPEGTFTFDGEIVVWGGERFEFNLALRRDCQSVPSKIARLAKQYPATYITFDLLHCNGQDLRAKPLRLRRAKLEKIACYTEYLQPCMTGGDGPIMWSAVEQFGLEGLIAKDLESRYLSDRQPSWIKVKRVKRCTVIVTGYDPGKGARKDRVGALHLKVLGDNGELVDVGRVGSGLCESDHAPMLKVLRTGHEFIVEVEYLELSVNGLLRQPVYKGVRIDVTRDDCTFRQLQ